MTKFRVLCGRFVVPRAITGHRPIAYARGQEFEGPLNAFTRRAIKDGDICEIRAEKPRKKE